MNLGTEIGIDVLTHLETVGYLSKAARFKDTALLPNIAALIDKHLIATRQEFAKFCIWWADIAHQAHQPDQAAAPFTQLDFWHCQNPLCLSLVGTVADLARELKTTPDALTPLS